MLPSPQTQNENPSEGTTTASEFPLITTTHDDAVRLIANTSGIAGDEVLDIDTVRTFSRALVALARRGEKAGVPSELTDLLRLPANAADNFVGNYEMSSRHTSRQQLRSVLKYHAQNLAEALTRFEAAAKVDSVMQGQRWQRLSGHER